MSSGNVIATPDTAHINLSALGFHHYAKQFVEAGRGIAADGKFSPVPYFLFCHAIELALKAFLLADGATVKSLKDKPKHNLVRGLKMATERGFRPDPEISANEQAALASANKQHIGGGWFRYFDFMGAITAYPDLPRLEVIQGIAERIVANVEPHCLES